MGRNPNLLQQWCSWVKYTWKHLHTLSQETESTPEWVTKGWKPRTCCASWRALSARSWSALDILSELSGTREAKWKSRSDNSNRKHDYFVMSASHEMNFFRLETTEVIWCVYSTLADDEITLRNTKVIPIPCPRRPARTNVFNSSSVVTTSCNWKQRRTRWVHPC